MGNELTGKRVAILATEGFEQAELTEPRKALEAAGAQTHVIALTAESIRGWNVSEWGGRVSVDKTVDAAEIIDYDLLLLPGGVQNPDKLRMSEDAVRFVGAFVGTGKPVAAICHAAWTLIEAGVVRGKRMTSWPSLKTDLTNAGAHWVDDQVVVDGNMITSRKPDDIPAFNRAIKEMLVGKLEAA
ncbi:MAG TPA: type 1 glutamine amidotransferase domain-containing protein [Acidobacteriaceae bacterium]